MPEDLAQQIPHLFKLFEAFGIPTIKVPGLEADDLIGSIVKQFVKEDLQHFIVSGDKDFMQLINDQVFLFSPKKGGIHEIVDEAGVKAKFDVRPDQVIDVLALMGDSSDNVPGVAGIGPKGASKLINTYGDLSTLLL